MKNSNRKHTGKVFILLGLIFCFSIKIQAANLYWVSAAASNWNNAANWSTLPAGPGGAGVPGVADVAIFTNNFNGNCTLDAAVTVLGFQITGFTGQVIQGGNAMTIGATGYSQSTGTFTGGTSNITINSTGLFSLTGGSFTSTDKVLTITGSRAASQTVFTHSGGTFSHNNGLVFITPNQSGCTQRTYTMDVNASSTVFNHLLIGATASCGINPIVTTGAGDVIQVIGDMTHNDGLINGSIAAQGNFIVGAGSDGGYGTISINGTGDQTYATSSTTARTCIISVNKSAGTFAPEVGTTDLLVQSFSLVAGSFTAPSSSLNCGGTWTASQTLFTHSGGTFIHNSGTIVMNPNQSGCTQLTFTVDIIPATSFSSFAINGTPSCGINPIITAAAGDVVSCVSDITHTDGIINGQFALEGNLIIQSGSDGGTGTITFNGSGAQTYSVAAGSPRTCQIAVNKPGGACSPFAGTTDFLVQSFSLIAGDFTSPTGTLNVGGTWTTSQTLFSHSGGIFNHNNGTVTINPNQSGCTQRTYTLDVIPSTTFYSLNINGTASCGINPIIATAAGDLVNCNSDITHTDGIISGQFAMQGNLFILAGSDGGTGSITVNGTTNETYNVAAGSPRTCKVIVDKSAGIFSPGAGTTDFFVQGFSLVAGDFTAPAGSLNTGGTWTSSQTLFSHSGGTFNHNNGTVTINPNQSGCTQLTFTVDVIPSTVFSSINLNGTASCGINPIIATAAGDVATCLQNITHTDAIINGQFNFDNNLIILVGSDGGTGTITADGTAAQTYSVAAGSPRTCKVVVDKTSGAFTPAVGTTDFFVQGFSLVAGDFTAPTGSLNTGGTWTSSQTLFAHSGGTFSHNNGTVAINPNQSGCTQLTFTVDVIPATIFSSINLNGTASCGINPIITTAAGDVATCVQNITHTDAIINGQFSFDNNLIILAGSDGGTGTITADGTGAQTYSVAAGSPRTCKVVVDKTSGALTPAVGTTDFFVQAFSLVAGDFTAPSGTLNTGGTWTVNQTLFAHSGGTFNHNNGTVTINPNQSGCTQRTYTIDVIPATIFSSINLNGTASCGINPIIATAAGDVATCLQNITHTDAIINGLFSFDGDLFILAGSDGGTGTITADGTAAQTYSVAAGSPRTCKVVVDKTSGALTPAAGTTEFFVQAFTLLAGDFTAPTGSLNTGGTWSANQNLFTHSGGNFSHNNGTVVINPNQSGCTQRTFTVDILPQTKFYNFTFNGTQSCGINPIITTAVNDSINVVNLTTYNDAIVNGRVEAEGNVTVSSTHDGGTGQLIFAGNASQNFDLTGATALFNGNVLVKKTNNKVNLLSSCVLDLNGQSITFNKGILVSTSSNMLILGDNVTALTASDSSFVDGPVRKIGNDVFTFPVGKNDSIYARIAISAPGNTSDHFTAEYFNDDPDAFYDRDLKDISLDHISQCEYWILDRTNGSSNVSVTLSWNTPRSCGVTNLADLAVARWDGTQWKDHQNGGTVGTTTTGTIVSLGTVTNFSPFTLASTSLSNPLPVELIDFNVIKKMDVAEISWTTKTENNNDYFTIQRSMDGINFTDLKTIDGAGNSNSKIDYLWIDESPLNGVSYYRLKQVDFDGQAKFSEIRVIDFTNDAALVYPNPVVSGGSVSIQGFDFNGSVVTYTLYDVSGRIILKEVLNDNEISINLPAGLYILYISDGISNVEQKLIVSEK